jgi:hypothetical protein
MQIAILALAGTCAAFAGAGLLFIFRWRADLRKLRGEIQVLQSRLGDEERRRRECEEAIDSYYIPHWQDAIERLGSAVVCTCPPERYRATCLQHSPVMARWQRTELQEIERRSLAVG